MLSTMRNYPAQSPQRRAQRGLALIESLVAIVVLSLGGLALLGIQLRTLNDTQASVRRAQAVRLIEDLSERIKVSPNGLAGLGSYQTGWDDTLSASTDCSTAACDSAQLASHDLKQWKDSVAALLPLGKATVFLAGDESNATLAPNRRQLGVMIGWRENERQKEGESNSDREALKWPFTNAVSTGSAKVQCPAGLICHLQYISPTQRCLPSAIGASTSPGGATVTPVFCPD